MQNQSIQKFLHNNLFLLYIFAIVFLCFALLFGIAKGSLTIPFSSIVSILLVEGVHLPLNVDFEPRLVNIIMDIRLPRVLIAAFVGASLAIAGASFQGLLKNPLADPYTLGVSSGASVGAVAVLFFGINIPLLSQYTLPFISIVFAFITLLLVVLFARFLQKSMAAETIILVGIVVSAFLGAVISLMIALTGEELRQILVWLMGSVGMRGWGYVWLIVPFFLIGAILILFNANELNALAFGEETARFLGVNVKVRKMMILIGASLLTGASVAVSGTIGFVGLVIPHLTRLLCGPNHRHLLPLSMLFGAGFLVIADLVARTIIAPTELPIGVLTSFIGAPIFGILLIKRRHKL